MFVTVRATRGHLPVLPLISYQTGVSVAAVSSASSFSTTSCSTRVSSSTSSLITRQSNPSTSLSSTVSRRCRPIFNHHSHRRHPRQTMSAPFSTSSPPVILPSTMTGPPQAVLVAPGSCQFGEEWCPVPLLTRTKISPTSSVLRFGLPDPTKPLQLSTCACLLANAVTAAKGEVTRPYTPISTNAQVGSFDLLVKDYGPELGTMSQHLCTQMKVGETVNFRHIPFNVKKQAPFADLSVIAMIVGGTGITPMIQALHAILGQGNNGTTPPPRQQKVIMLYGSRSSDDILGMDLLTKWAEEYASVFEVVHILSHEPADSTWSGERGFINKERIEKYFPSPTDTNEPFQIWVCGPPVMYEALCGPRTETDSVKGLLGEMGYQPHQVYKF